MKCLKLKRTTIILNTVKTFNFDNLLYPISFWTYLGEFMTGWINEKHLRREERELIYQLLTFSWAINLDFQQTPIFPPSAPCQQFSCQGNEYLSQSLAAFLISVIHHSCNSLSPQITLKFLLSYSVKLIMVICRIVYIAEEGTQVLATW